jgi:hypothetical protein
LVEDLAAELSDLGREEFAARYGRYFLVLTDRDLIDDASEFVNTASRDGSDILAGRGRDLDVHPLAKPRVTVGRDAACDVRIKHPRVSSLHGTFTRGGGLLFITDARSKNGIKVNGLPLAADQPAPVDAGDLIQFGPVRATVWGLDDVAAAARR